MRVLLAFLIVVAFPAAASAAVPPATLTKVDVPGTTAFAATPDDLSAYGYVEEEYYVSGTANRYRIADPLRDAQVVDGGHPYKTRMIIRRPADPAKFNGTLAVEWYNVTTGQDIDFDWAASHEYLMRNGYAAVSLSAQLVGVERLKTWSPARYGDLSLTAPNADPAGGVLDARGDVLGWDVFSQTVQALRGGALASLAVKRVIANGESQSAGRLTSYYNSIDPLHRVVDGIVYYDRGGPWRTDSPTKAISVATEFGSRSGATLPDSPSFRLWEVAGSSHVSLHDVRYVDAITGRDKGLPAPVTLTELITGCAYEPLWSTVPTHHVLNSAFDHVNRWIQGFPAPPSAPRMEREGTGLKRDGDNRVVGGIRLADFTHPTAFTLGGLNTGPGFCYLAGHHRFYTASELAARYPDPHVYVRGVVDTTAGNLAAGYVLGADAGETVAAAYRVFDLGTTTGTVGGNVPATLSLSIGSASFGAFTPGVAREYTATTTATVTSSAGDATLSVGEPGRLANGAFTLAQPLRVLGLPKTYAGPVANDAVPIAFAQAIGASEPLRTGTYATTLTFTLSTTNP
jgi:hypothetical protein